MTIPNTRASFCFDTVPPQPLKCSTSKLYLHTSYVFWAAVDVQGVSGCDGPLLNILGKVASNATRRKVSVPLKDETLLLRLLLERSHSPLRGRPLDVVCHCGVVPPLYFLLPDEC